MGKLKDKGALLVEDDEFDKIQPLIETELEKVVLKINEIYPKVNWDSNLPIYNISQSELQKKELILYC